MAGRHRQTKLTVAFICSGYNKAHALIQGDCAKLSAYSLWFLYMTVIHTLIHLAGADTKTGDKLQNTFDNNSMAKGKKQSSSNISSFLGALGNVCNPKIWYLTHVKC